MTRLKRWLCEKFLPAWCREELTEENERLRTANTGLWNENQRLRAYISGLETAMRCQRRAVIRNEVGK